MSSPVAIAAPKLSPVEQFKMQILPPERAAELHRALPAHIRPERFERNLLNALMQNPKLLQCDPRLVYREVSKAAGLGLVLDPQLGEAYILLTWDGKTQKEVPQLRIGYRGIMKLARQSGEVASIYAHPVRQNDHIVCELGDHPKLEHRPELFGDRGPVIGYYAVIRYKDGETDFEPMNRAEVEAIRARSDAYKAFVMKKIKSTPWDTDFDEMARKTVIRRLMKRVPQSPDLADVMAREDRADERMRLRDVTGEAGVPLPPPSKLDQLEDATGAAVDVPDEDLPEGVDPETGEVMGGEPDKITTAQPDPLAPVRAALDSCSKIEDVDGVDRDLAELIDDMPLMTKQQARGLILEKRQQFTKGRK